MDCEKATPSAEAVAAIFVPEEQLIIFDNIDCFTNLFPDQVNPINDPYSYNIKRNQDIFQLEFVDLNTQTYPIK